MNWLYRLQRKFGRYSIENLMIYITVTMLAVYLMDAFIGVGIAGWLNFDSFLIFRGQIWRLITFIFMPPSSGNPLFLLLALYFYYFVGDSLEKTWGSFQFMVYYICGIIGTVIAGLLTGSAGNSYLNLSLFFAFAQLFPDHQVLLFFIIPVKIKYLAYLNWILFAGSFVLALISLDIASCASILASLLNFFIFFGPDFLDRYRDWRRYGKQRRNWKQRSKNKDNNFWR
ncbi:hypothetical protein FACS1894191_2790 [Clostridia bacterium]|nr:hypothetical protein FACS1894191_2790 [Clostridia bacterium]